MTGLSGRFSDWLRAALLSLHDNDGGWTRIDDLELVWSPLRLITGDDISHRRDKNRRRALASKLRR
jgi:hypothetical protein